MARVRELHADRLKAEAGCVASGHEGYVVGGAVRDLLLKGRPKDFDILTTATTHQVCSRPHSLGDMSLPVHKLARFLTAISLLSIDWTIGKESEGHLPRTAVAAQVKNLLHRSRLIGKRFPIVQVVVEGDMMEVSSFATGVPLSDLPFDAAALLGNRVSLFTPPGFGGRS